MRTHIASGETRELTARGALRLALHDGRVHVLNHNNHQKLEAFDVLTGQALGFVPVPRWAHLALDGQAALAVDQRGAKGAVGIASYRPGAWRRAEVLRTGAGCGLTPWRRHATEDAARDASAVFIWWSDFRRVTTRLLHVRASDGHPNRMASGRH